MPDFAQFFLLWDGSRLVARWQCERGEIRDRERTVRMAGTLHLEEVGAERYAEPRPVR